jgi:hypothetical protein
MTITKLVLGILILAIIVVGGHDLLEIVDAQRNVRNVASDVASTAANAIACSHAGASGKPAAQQVAAQSNDVVTKYSYDPVGATVSATVGATADTWVVGRIDRRAADSINATSKASLPTQPYCPKSTGATS